MAVGVEREPEAVALAVPEVVALRALVKLVVQAQVVPEEGVFEPPWGEVEEREDEWVLPAMPAWRAF